MINALKKAQIKIRNLINGVPIQQGAMKQEMNGKNELGKVFRMCIQLKKTDI